MVFLTMFINKIFILYLIKGSYVCSCPTGFTGADCADLIQNPCELNVCSFIGTERCIQNISSYYCKCNLGFNGTYCEHMISPCISSPCMNNGTCIIQAGKYINGLFLT